MKTFRESWDDLGDALRDVGYEIEKMGRACGDWCAEHIFATTMFTLALLGLVIGISTALAQEPTPTFTDCAEHFVIAKTLDGCEDVIGHGVTYDPRGERRSITTWDCPSGLVVRLTEYGEPSEFQLNGPVIGETILPDAVVEWLQDRIGVNVVVTP